MLRNETARPRGKKRAKLSSPRIYELVSEEDIKGGKRGGSTEKVAI